MAAIGTNALKSLNRIAIIILRLSFMSGLLRFFDRSSDVVQHGKTAFSETKFTRSVEERTKDELKD